MTSVKSLVDTRQYAFSKLNEHFDKDVSKEIEISMLGYVKKESEVKYKLDQLRWSDIRVRRLYIGKFRMIMSNIDSVKQQMLMDQVPPSQVGCLDHYQLKPEIYEPIYEKKKKREMLSILTDAEEKHDGILKCDNCKGWKTRYTELQTRGGDEPMTVFALCLECDHHWMLDGK